MDNIEFLTRYNTRKDQVIEDTPVCSSRDGELELRDVLILHEGVYYLGTVSVDSRKSVVNPTLKVESTIREVVPREVKTTVYDDVFTIKGTREELLKHILEGLDDIDYLYRDVTEPYVGSLEKYEKLSDREVQAIANEVLNELIQDMQVRHGDVFTHWGGDTVETSVTSTPVIVFPHEVTKADYLTPEELDLRRK